MVCRVEQSNQLKPTGGNLGHRPICTTTLVGSFIGVSAMEVLDIMTLPLSQGLFALVDGKNYEWLSQWKWSAAKGYSTYYAFRSTGGRKNKHNILMHRIVMGAKKGSIVDHINHNGLDNRKSNLRFCTQAQNQYNQKHRNSSIYSSKYKGVCWDKRKIKWMSTVRFDGKCVFAGYYNSEIEAAKSYDKKARKLFGKFACLNFNEKLAPKPEKLFKD